MAGRKNHRRYRSAFTLVELIIVIVVLGILATIAIVGYNTVVSKSVEAKQMSRMTQVLKAAKVLYTQKIYSDATYTWNQAVADAVDDLPEYSLNAWSEGPSATGGSDLNAATNGWTLQVDTGDVVFSAAPNDIVVSTVGEFVYVASAIDTTSAVFGMISATTAPVVWTATCLGSSCDAESASAGPPASGAYAPGSTTSTTSTTTTTTPTPTTIATTTTAPTTTVAPTTTAIITPGAPTISSVTAAHLSLSVAFSAPAANGGNTPSNYEYSTNNGSTWTTRSPVSTSSPISITGLTNGTSYQVKIRAVNNGGAGTASNTMSGTPQWSAMSASCSGCSSTTVVSGGRTYQQYTFTASGSMTINSIGSDASVDYLVVGGGGGGATHAGNGGAGGSGGQTRHGSLSVAAGAYSATVGQGGAGVSTISTPGGAGGSSVFGSITASGGCSGIAYACGMNYVTIFNSAGFTYRNGGSWVFFGGGGGAGAGGDGGAAPGNETGGNGGSGITLWGSTYSGGGGGGGGSQGQTASGGSSGGAGRGFLAGGAGSSAPANTGSGGGGGYSSAGNGGSGIVIVRYAITAP